MEKTRNMRKAEGVRAVSAIVLLALLASTGLWVLTLRVGGNIHAVERGAFYRSAQLGPDKLAATIKSYGIRTVINLRGAAPGEKWYENEIAVSRRLHTEHIDLHMDAEKIPDAQTTQRLIYYMRNSPKPILVHCKAGADRAGFASALYLLVVRHMPPTEASAQLSIRYGHFPWIGKTAAMDIAFDRFSQVGGTGRVAGVRQ